MFKDSLTVLKNSIKVLFAAGILLSLPMTQVMAAEPTEQELAAEPALTQQDIDTFVSKTDQYVKIIKDPAAAETVLKELKMTEARFVVVSTKLSIGYTIIMLTDLKQPIPQQELDALPAGLKPSEAEMELMKANKDKIQAAFVTIGEAVEEK
jgi:hypothetical protein